MYTCALPICTFVITGVADSSSSCKFQTHLEATIHALPSIRMSKGRESVVDIHEGGEADLLFELGGEAPWEFTYTRSENVKRGRKQGRVLETKTERTESSVVSVKAGEEGTYEVVAVRDRWCSVRKSGGDGAKVKGEKLLVQ